MIKQTLEWYSPKEKIPDHDCLVLVDFGRVRGFRRIYFTRARGMKGVTEERCFHRPIDGECYDFIYSLDDILLWAEIEHPTFQGESVC